MIEDPGDSKFHLDQLVSQEQLADEINRLALDPTATLPKSRRALPATSRRILMGITHAALTTESFISAASFQETTRVLTNAAINGKVDNLVGLKENVIMGNLIPAGTGLSRYDQLHVVNPDEVRESREEVEDVPAES